MLGVYSFATYFSRKGKSSSEFLKFDFIEDLSWVSREDQYQDLELFNRSIDAEDLLLLVVFWHLTSQDDLNPTNIIFRPTSDGKIAPTVIDYDVSLGNTGDVVKRVPMIYPLKQSTASLGWSARNRVNQISENRLKQVMDAYKGRKIPFTDKTKPFTSADQIDLAARLRTIKQIVGNSSTVRQVMHGLIPARFEGTQSLAGQALLNWQQSCEKELHCTVVNPFVGMKECTIQGMKASGTRFIEIQGIRLPTAHLYPLEYVFSADRKAFLEGENDGTNLQGYLPFTNENLLWGLGI